MSRDATLLALFAVCAVLLLVTTILGCRAMLRDWFREGQ